MALACSLSFSPLVGWCFFFSSLRIFYFALILKPSIFGTLLLCRSYPVVLLSVAAANLSGILVRSSPSFHCAPLLPTLFSTIPLLTTAGSDTLICGATLFTVISSYVFAVSTFELLFQTDMKNLDEVPFAERQCLRYADDA
uniref:Uncharacterized protein n=1 Tax=Ananas comosus var. bracteatus TaxID=296719 RepID=A0A6V7PP37_ANACO|nr:unnamed protein product [Ananas comosus var. bracteatus]